MSNMSWVCLMILMTSAATADSPLPYAGQESREIKALSQQEVSELLKGQGMGFAKAAELNGYPGPAHVLELAPQLTLSREQLSRTEALFQEMQEDAVRVGSELVEAERQLDQRFSAHSVTSASLRLSLARIAELRAELRRVHLEAHLRQYRLLSEAQVEAYRALRGYAASNAHSSGTHRHH